MSEAYKGLITGDEDRPVTRIHASRLRTDSDRLSQPFEEGRNNVLYGRPFTEECYFLKYMFFLKKNSQLETFYQLHFCFKLFRKVNSFDFFIKSKLVQWN